MFNPEPGIDKDLSLLGLDDPFPFIASTSIGIPIEAKIVPHLEPICFLVGLRITGSCELRAFMISCLCFVVRTFSICGSNGIFSYGTITASPDWTPFPNNLSTPKLPRAKTAPVKRGGAIFFTAVDAVGKNLLAKGAKRDYKPPPF